MLHIIDPDDPADAAFMEQIERARVGQPATCPIDGNPIRVIEAVAIPHHDTPGPHWGTPTGFLGLL